MRVTFGEVAIREKKKGKCRRCGKRTSRTQKFYQTLNPFNRTKSGALKQRDQIVQEITKEAATWKRKPVVCTQCEYKEANGHD